MKSLKNTTEKRLLIPSLKGHIGDRITYTCLMRFEDIKNRVHFAKELHTSKKLSEMIQRELSNDRAKEIGQYLLENEDRFFNSLVLAIYKGDPTWHQIDRITPNNEESANFEIPDYATESMGFLSLNSKEKIFALDGQHRLAGIIEALKNKSAKSEELSDELLSVIIVSHKETDKGMKASRRLFTTLNKKAKLVSQSAIIALDEDDISACITRWLVENTEYFSEDNVAFITGSLRDQKSITTIGNIYNCCKKLVACYLNKSIGEVEQHVYTEDEKHHIQEHINQFYSLTFKKTAPLREASEFKGNADIITKYRSKSEKDHLLFRPIGWDLYTDSIVFLMNNKRKTLVDSISEVSKKNLFFEGAILKDQLWSSESGNLKKLSAELYDGIVSKLTEE